MKRNTSNMRLSHISMQFWSKSDVIEENYSNITHINLESFLWDIGKSARPDQMPQNLKSAFLKAKGYRRVDIFL